MLFRTWAVGHTVLSSLLRSVQMVWYNPGTEGLIVQLQVDGSQLAQFCRHNRICRLSFFGSVLREDFDPDSDVDVLVEFEPGAKVGLLRMAALESELSQVVGRKVDMRTAADLSRYFRDEVVAGAKVQYAA